MRVGKSFIYCILLMLMPLSLIAGTGQVSRQSLKDEADLKIALAEIKSYVNS